MSFMGDFLGGSEGQPARVQDIRTEQGRELGSMTQSALANILQGGGNSPFLQPSPTPLAAQMSPEETALVNRIGQQTFNDPRMTAAGNQLMFQSQGGGMNPLATQVGPQSNQVAMDIMSGRTMDPSTNPALQASIDAAIRPLEERFSDQMGSARGEFTQAGQFVQPGASSPFETAQARLQTGLADAIGDVSTNLVAENLAQERARQMQVMGQTNQAFESGQNRSLQAAAQTAPFTSTQISNMMQGLEASALPRLVEQYGIDEGTRRYERQQNQLLGALETAFGGVGTPQAVQMPGQEGSSGLMGGIASGLGPSLGEGMGDWIGGMFGGEGGSGGGFGDMLGGMFGGGSGNEVAGGNLFDTVGATQGIMEGGSAGGGSLFDTVGTTQGLLGGGGGSGLFNTVGTTQGLLEGGSAASGSGGGGFMSGVGSVASNPWAWLAAAVVGNEWAARDAGRRDENEWTHLQDLLTGKVLEQDMDYYGDKIGGVGGEIVEMGGQLGHPEGVWDFIRGDW